MPCHISIISPVYKGETILPELVSRIKQNVETFTNNYEIVLVEDCGPDNSWAVIKNICLKDSHVIGIKLSRNFGQHYAISAGLNIAKGDWIVVMDCDLQDRPEEIPRLYSKASTGFDIVLASRFNRKDSFLKKLFSKIFYSVLAYLTETKQDHTVGNFGIYHHKVIKSINSLGDSIRYFPTMVKWVGYKSTTQEVIHDERASGQTSYTFKKLVKLSSDIILSFSDLPLRLTVKFGLAVSSFAVLLGLYYLIKYLKGEILVPGWTTLIVSIWFLSGAIIFVLGVLGLYIGKTFEKVKNRPSYIIDEFLNI